MGSYTITTTANEDKALQYHVDKINADAVEEPGDPPLYPTIQDFMSAMAHQRIVDRAERDIIETETNLRYSALDEPEKDVAIGGIPYP